MILDVSRLDHVFFSWLTNKIWLIRKSELLMPLQFSRPLGDSELSYFLPSRADGVNDMYLHLGFRASNSVVNPSRVRLAWGILRARHPLLAAHVLMKPGEYNSAHFVYSPPSSPENALEEASANFEVRKSTKDVLIDSYLNGPRTLSPERISYLVLSSPAPLTPPLTPPPSPYNTDDEAENEMEEQQFDFLICAAHFLGDGMALHTFANELFMLLCGNEYKDNATLQALLTEEWTSRWAHADPAAEALPASLEARLPKALNAFQRAAHQLEFQCAQARLIGGHAFKRVLDSTPRHTIVPTVSFDHATTRAALATCKAHGVSIANAMIALCNIVWARVGGGRPELPMMIYSALNLRPYLTPPSPGIQSTSYWFLAVGYFNVVLPTFLPSDVHKTFWLRARAAKAQSVHAAKTPLLVARTRCMAEERGARARAFALIDDGDSHSPAQLPTPVSTPTPIHTPKLPSMALIGLSLLGNLDNIYAHKLYDSRVRLHTLTTGSRQRKGGMLLFVYTFAGKLWLCFGYDSAAYESREVGRWWGGVVAGVKEFLVPDQP